MKKIPVIIDCDPGTDDAFAIALAKASGRLDIRALTPVSGNVGLEHTAPNALALNDYLGLGAPVGKGAARPMIKERVINPATHGENGLGEVELPAPRCTFEEDPAWDVIYREAVAQKGELEIAAIGPLTNIAITLLKYPDIKPLIKRITMMGGAWGVGNSTPYAEFNIWIDPHACDVVFKSGIPITMVGLDATRQTFFTAEEMDRLLAPDCAISPLLRGIWEYTRAQKAREGRESGIILHDALAIAALYCPEVIRTEPYFATCEVRGSLTEGQTVVDLPNRWKKEPNVDVAMSADKEKLYALLQEMVAFYQN
ncbi:nucleoside hydrolase [Acetanaerobacterium sp. MSJ-12]|uniref:nucleoside hydrolase n=1 Tax=Acetanaerobacterium sp. MSJ-12 TaxID=2841535 RepID=UPI001C0F1DDF|nr:nucleoside hydrolase [Acetanaerobacterium sp. MSJ-12]